LLYGCYNILGYNDRSRFEFGGGAAGVVLLPADPHFAGSGEAVLVASRCGHHLPLLSEQGYIPWHAAQQKFDENKIPIEASFQVVGGRPVMAISTCRLNFYLPSYTKARKQEFSLVAVQREHSQDYELGEFRLSVDELVGQLKEQNRVRHEFRASFSDDYELEFEVYVERSRMALERAIRDNKVERINKSPLRARREDSQPSPKKTFSPTHQHQYTPSRDQERPTAQPQEQAA
jgi:hypothetical protein